MKKTVSKPQPTTSKLYILYTLGFLSLTLPLLHIEASNEPNTGLKAVLGFSTWRKLLFAIGFPMALLFLNTCLYLIRPYISNTGISRSIKHICYLIFALCFFFLVWDFHPTIEDYPKWAYRLGSLAIGLFLTFIYTKAVNYINEVHTRAVELSKGLYSLVNKTRKKLPYEHKKELMKDLHETVNS